MSNSLHMAWQALQRGDRQAAHAQTIALVHQDPRNPGVWLLLSDIMLDPAQQRDCLQRVVALDPDNRHAHQRLAALAEAPSIAPAQAVATRSPVSSPTLFERGYLPTPDELQKLALSGRLPQPNAQPAPASAASGLPLAILGVAIALGLLGLMLILASIQ